MSYPEYTFQSRFLSVRGTRLHYIEEGPVTGEPVVMVHGNPTWSFFFRKLITRLCDRYRTLAPDHVGMGLSATPGDDAYDYRLASRVDDLSSLLEARRFTSNLTLVVHDWGGAIGLGYALRHPERVKRLVLFNTAAFHLPEGMSFPRDLARVRTPVLGPFFVRGLNAFSGVAVRRCAVTPLAPGVRRAYLEPYNNWHNRLAVLRFVQDIPLRPTDCSYDLVSRIEESLARYRDLPVLICWGMRDILFGPDYLSEWTRRLPAAEVHRYDDAGHYLLEDAGEEVSRTVRAFLDRHTPGSCAGTGDDPS